MKKLYVKVDCMLVVIIDDIAEINDVLNEMDYNFIDTTTKADITKTEILDWEVVDCT